MKTDKDNDLYQKFQFIKNKTLSYEIAFYIDEKEDKSIFGSSGFTPKVVSNNKHHYIVINSYLINLYSKRPSIVLSILINAFMSANIYFDNNFNNDINKKINKLLNKKKY